LDETGPPRTAKWFLTPFPFPCYVIFQRRLQWDGRCVQWSRPV